MGVVFLYPVAIKNLTRFCTHLLKDDRKMQNIACRIFLEQIKMLQSLPNQEEAKTILYYAIINSLNQFENQNDNQIENQFENAYVSVSDSLSVLSKSIYDLLLKSIVWKEFSNNYGGKRENAGRKSNDKKGGNPTLKGTLNPTLKQQEKTKQDITDINKKYQKEFEEFWKEYPKQRAGSKEKAYTSYCKAIDKNKITTEKLLEVVKRYAISKEVREGYAKGCAAWLNDDRFNDEKLNPFVGVRGNWYYCEDGTRVEL